MTTCSIVNTSNDWCEEGSSFSETLSQGSAHEWADLTPDGFREQLVREVVAHEAAKLGYSMPFSGVSVPYYDDTVSNGSVALLLQGTNLSETDMRSILKGKGYPEFRVSGILAKAMNTMAFASKGEGKVTARAKAAEDILDVVRSGPGVHRRRVPGCNMGVGRQYEVTLDYRFQPHWNPKWPAPGEKPAHWCTFEDRVQFRNWVNYQGWLLQREIKNKPKLFVTMNLAAQTLFLMRTIDHKDPESLLADARVYVGSFDNQVRAPRTTFLYEFIDMPVTVTLGDVEISSLDEWKAVEGSLARDKPFFRAGVRAFSDPINGVREAHELSRRLRERYAPRHFELSGMSYSHSTWSVTRGVVDAEDWDAVSRWLRYQASVCPSSPRILPQYQGGAASKMQSPANGLAETVGESATRGAVKALEESGAASRIGGDLIRGAATEVMDTAREFLGAFGARIVAFITALVVADNWKQRCAALLQFCAGCDRANVILGQVLQGFSGGLVYQGADSGGEPVDDVSKSGILAAVWEAVADGVAGLNGFAVDGLKSILSATRWAFFGAVGKDIAESVIIGLREFAVRVKCCVQQRSITPLFGDSYNPERLVAFANTYRGQYGLLIQADTSPQARVQILNLVKDGLLPAEWSHPVDVGEYKIRVRRLLGSMDELLSLYDRSFPFLTAVQQERSRLSEFIADLGCGPASRRIVPFSCYLWGPPGTGKTNVLADLENAVLNRFGLERGSGAVAAYQPGFNFQSQLKSETRIFTFNDSDIAFPKVGEQSDASFFIGLVDSAPFEVESAIAELKGKVFPQPAAVFVASNNPDLRVADKVTNPVAFHRRVHLKAEVLVKPEFRVDGGEALDPAKVKAAGSPFDIHEIHVYRWDGKKFARLYKEAISDSEFYKLYFILFEAHYNRQKEDLQRGIQRTENLCGVCHLPRDRGCGHEPDASVELDNIALQGLVPSLDSLRRWQQTARSALIQMGDWMRSSLGSVLAAASIMRTKAERSAMQARADAALTLGRVSRSLALLSTMYLPLLKRVGVALAGVVLVAAAWRLRPQARVGSAEEVRTGWVRADNNYIPSALKNVSTWSYEELETATRAATMEAVNRSTGVSMFAVCFQAGCVVVPKHLARPPGEPVSCSQSVLPEYGQRLEFKFRDLSEVYAVTTSALNTHLLPHPELMVVSVPNLMTKRTLDRFSMSTADVTLGGFDSFDFVRMDALQSASGAYVGTLSGTRNYFASLDTRPGDCGLVYIGRLGGRSFVAGLHWAANTIGSDGNLAICAPLARDEVQRIAHSRFNHVHVQSLSVALSLITRESEPRTTGGYNASSHVHVAITEGAPLVPVGVLLNGPPGATPKSKIVPSLLQSEVFSAFPEVRPGDFVTPNFRGRMVEAATAGGDPYSRFESPFTRGFEPRNDAELQEEHVLALWDYLQGMPDPIRDPVSVSIETAVAGVPGTVLHGANQATSIGPPFVGPKSRFIDVVETDKSVYFDPDIAAQVHEVESILASGSMPHTVAVATLKDEVLKAGKSPRVFFVLPGVLNLFMKRDLGPIREFMGRHPAFFECMVGINMVSLSQYNEFISALESLPGHYADLDAKHLDKVFKGLAYLECAIVFYAIASKLGLNPQRTAGWLGSMSGAFIQQARDVFMALFNLSGNDVTVQLNSIFQSVSMRAVWYRRNPDVATACRSSALRWFARFTDQPLPEEQGPSPFRLNNVLRTYGDDMILKTTMGLAGLPSQWLELNGVEITDADKGDEIRPKLLEETTFLKRRPLYDGELRCWTAALEIRSVVKMLLFKKNKSMSDVDAMCDVVTNARREAALRPREQLFDRLEPLVQRLATLAPGNRYLDRRSYDSLRFDLSQGRLQTWRVEDPPLPEVGFELSAVAYQGGLVGPSGEPETFLPSNMSSVNIVEGGNDSASDQSGVSHPTLEMTTPTTAFASSASAVVVPLTAPPKFFQQISTAPLSTFLTRPVRIHEWDLGPTDAAGSFVGTPVDPWKLFHQDSGVQKKTASFLAMRGTTEVYAVVSIPGQCSGAYVLSAFPDPFDPSDDDTAGAIDVVTDYPGNCMAVDHYARIDCSTSESVVMQLPFIYPKDYMRFSEITLAPGGTMWELRLTCLSPLRTAIVGGVPSGRVTLYAAMSDDFDMVLPSYQGGYREKSPGLKPSAAMKAMAPGAYARVSRVHEVVRNSGLLGAEQGLSGAVGAISQTVGKLSGIPIIGPFAAAASGIGSAASGVLDMFGFTRRGVDPSPERSYLATTSNVATVDSDDLSLVAGLSRANAITIDPSVMGVGPEDQLSFTSIFEHWTVAGRFEWSPTSPGGTELWNLHVTPFWSPVGRLDGTGDPIHLSAAGYVGLPFSYWRGSMEYLVVFAVSKLHRGAVQAYFIPEGGNPPGASDPTNTTHNIIYEVAAGEDLSLRLGYCSPEPVLNCQVMCRDDMGSSFGSDCLGRLCFRVVNPLQSQLGVSETPVTVTVFQRACPDMRFFKLRESLMTYADTVPFNFPMDGLAYQGGAVGDDDQLGLKSHDLVPLPPPYPLTELLAGEEVVSARALMQKPSFMRLGSKAVTSDQTWSLARYGLPGRSFTSVTRGDLMDRQPFCLGFHYRLLFAMVAGSERWKFLGPRQAWVAAGATDSLVSGSPFRVGSLYPVTNAGPTRGAEFIIPYYGRRKFVNGRLQLRVVPFDRRGRTNVLYAGLDLDARSTPIGEWTPNVTWSFGPDLRAAVFAGVPRLYIEDGTSTRFSN